MKRFKAMDRRRLEASLVPDVEFIADRLVELVGADLHMGEAMVAAYEIRPKIVEALTKEVEEELGVVFEPPGTKKIYWRTSVVRRNDPGACGECGIAAGMPSEWVDEDSLSWEDVGERLAELLDRVQHLRESCPGCGGTMAVYGAVEVED
jgi:hypothetical protein